MIMEADEATEPKPICNADESTKTYDDSNSLQILTPMSMVKSTVDEIYDSLTPPPSIHSQDSSPLLMSVEEFPLDKKLVKSAPSILATLLPSATRSNKPIVAVLGVGYVGLELVKAFSLHYQVIAFDISEDRLKSIQEKEIIRSPHGLIFSTNTEKLYSAAHYLIAVPTTVRPDGAIDTSHMESAVALVSKHARPGCTVVIESTVAVGTTREMLGRMAKEAGLKAGMSPERVDPGRVSPTFESTPKIISGLDSHSLDSIEKLYSEVFETLVKVSSPEVAEMCKLYENCQRMVCIAYANEMWDAARSVNIDPFEVCRTAATKPFGYHPFTPSPGVGGNCIPINPYYLLSNLSFPLLEQATKTTMSRPMRMAQNIVEMLAKQITKKEWPQIVVVGAAFKPGQRIVDNSPSIAMMREMKKMGVVVKFYDSLVEQSAVPDIEKLHESDWKEKYLDEHIDLVVVGMKQIGIDFEVLKRCERIQIDWLASGEN